MRLISHNHKEKIKLWDWKVNYDIKSQIYNRKFKFMTLKSHKSQLWEKSQNYYIKSNNYEEKVKIMWLKSQLWQKIKCMTKQNLIYNIITQL